MTQIKIQEIVKIRANNPSLLAEILNGRKVPIIISKRPLKVRYREPKLDTWAQVLKFWFDL